MLVCSGVHRQESQDQHREDDGLHQAHYHLHEVEGNRQAEGENGGHRSEQDLAGIDIAEEPEGKARHLCQLADDLDEADEDLNRIDDEDRRILRDFSGNFNQRLEIDKLIQITPPTYRHHAEDMAHDHADRSEGEGRIHISGRASEIRNEYLFAMLLDDLPEGADSWNEADPIVEETADISKAEDVVEPAVEASTDEVIEKNDFDELKEMLASITKTLSTIPDVLGALADSTKAVNERVTELEAVAKSAVAGLTEAQSENEKLGKRMESVEASTAFRKSADVGDIVQAAPEVQSIWGGRFLDGTTGLSR